MGFSRQEYWNGLPFPSPGDLPDPGIEPRSPTLQADALTSASNSVKKKTNELLNVIRKGKEWIIANLMHDHKYSSIIFPILLECLGKLSLIRAQKTRWGCGELCGFVTSVGFAPLSTNQGLNTHSQDV